MTLTLFSGADPVAGVEATPEGPRLAYLDAWRRSPAAFPVSLTLRLGAPEHGPDVVTPWLMNLLPEGEPLQATTRALGVTRQDVLGLMETRDATWPASFPSERHGRSKISRRSRWTASQLSSASSTSCQLGRCWWARKASR
ncbi:HipA N-terminal domain-containing protein [Phenylobacterium sp.]|uniref:HipA N-terminal domain-containing protein n=1 Tax=Phenylobacterium sp. TaxID=1871053 RepID=UPI0035B0B567